MSISEETKAAATQCMASSWSPFQSTAFTVLWTATVVANIGSWIYSGPKRALGHRRYYLDLLIAGFRGHFLLLAGPC